MNGAILIMIVKSLKNEKNPVKDAEDVENDKKMNKRKIINIRSSM
jgi:hypothetical protein